MSVWYETENDLQTPLNHAGNSESAGQGPEAASGLFLGTEVMDLSGTQSHFIQFESSAESH